MDTWTNSASQTAFLLVILLLSCLFFPQEFFLASSNSLLKYTLQFPACFLGHCVLDKNTICAAFLSGVNRVVRWMKWGTTGSCSGSFAQFPVSFTTSVKQMFVLFWGRNFGLLPSGMQSHFESVVRGLFFCLPDVNKILCSLSARFGR